MVEAIGEVCRTFTRIVSEKKTETSAHTFPTYTVDNDASRTARQTYNQVQSFTCLRGTATEILDTSSEIARQTRACWTHIRRYLREFYNQPKVALSLGTRLVKVDAIEALLNGCITWTLCQKHYSKLRTLHYRVLLLIIGAQLKSPDHRMTSCNNHALDTTGYESIETTVHTTIRL